MLLEVSEFWRERALRMPRSLISEKYVSIGDFVLGMGVTNIVEHWMMVEEIWNLINRSRRTGIFACVKVSEYEGKRMFSFLVKKDWKPEELRMYRMYIKREDYKEVVKILREHGYKPECELFRLDGVFILGWRLREEINSGDSKLGKKLRKYVYVEEIKFGGNKNG